MIFKSSVQIVISRYLFKFMSFYYLHPLDFKYLNKNEKNMKRILSIVILGICIVSNTFSHCLDGVTLTTQVQIII